MPSEGSILSDLIEEIRQAGVPAGMEKLDQILALQGKVEREELQRAYVQGILLLVRKSPEEPVLEELSDRLRKTPAYDQDQQLIAEHGLSLVEAAGKAASYRTALQRAQAVMALKGYGTSEVLQNAHAEALFSASQQPGSDVFEVIRQISEVPSFRDSAEIQFAAAKALCNFTSEATSKSKLDRAILAIEGLPRLAEDSRLQESLEKAKRNRERFLDLASERSKGVPWKGVAASGVLLAGLAAAAIFFPSSAKPSTQHTPAPIASESRSPKEMELEKYLSKANVAYAEENYEDASLYARMALKRADTLNDVSAQMDCYDLIASSALHGGEKSQLELLGKIPQSYLPSTAEHHLATAQRHAQKGKTDSMKTELTLLIHLAKQAENRVLDPMLESAYLLCEERESWRLGGLIQSHLGQLAQAAELAQRSGDAKLAESLLRQLAKEDPEQSHRLKEFLTKQAQSDLTQANESLRSEQFEIAESKAQSALAKFSETEADKSEEAKAYTVLAKSAYLQGNYETALEHARTAFKAAPNEERKQRLATYEYKDASIVTLDELDVEAFVFPPARKSDKFYTYFFCYLKAGRNGSAQEELFQPPKDEVTARLAYGSPEQGVSVRVETYTGRYYSVNFDAHHKKQLKPGVYEGATRFPFNNNNPGIDFSGNGAGHNRSRGKFKVHQVEFRGKQLVSLAVDYIFEGQSSVPQPIFGKIRYNSHYE